MNSRSNIAAEDIALSFHDLGISTVSPPKAILQNVSGFILKGGITAVLGASPSGKSVLLNVLGGRMPGFHIKGQITFEGMSIDAHDLKNEISCVPASDQDFLAAELTPRETLLNTLLLKKGGLNNNVPELMKEVDNLLNVFSLNHVADVPIGYTLELGLLGGERKRVEVCSELIASHPVLLLDEPTSGLDGCIAYEVLVAIKKMIRLKKGELSILLSIHQPNRRILDLFDHILLLGRGGTMHFFGTVSECMDYFTSIGFAPSMNYTPTDVFLQMTDSHFGSHRETNFEGLFACSSFASNLHFFLNEVERKGNLRKLKTVIIANAGVGANDLDLENSQSRLLLDPFHDVPLTSRASKSKRNTVAPVADTSDKDPQAEQKRPLSHLLDSLSMVWNQYRVLLYRDFTIAYRDRSLYFLQMLASIGFGFFVGAVFFKLKFEVWTLMVMIQIALSWVVMILCYTQVFKIYHLTRANLRFKHEMSNNAYTPAIAWFTELTTTAIMVNVLLPGVFVALAMMKVPTKSYGFFVVLSWMTALTVESMFYLITKFTDSPSFSVVVAQAILVVLTVFEGGVFISWQSVPRYWYWLQELSIFTQASRAAIMNVNDFATYPCQVTYGMCITFYGTMPCDASPATDLFGTCEVKGRSLMHTILRTIPDESKWVPFAYIVLIFGVCRLTALFLMYYPWEMISGKMKHFVFGYPSSELLECKMELTNVKNQLTAVIADRRRGGVQKKAIEMEKVHSSSASTAALATATHSISNELNDDKCEETRLVGIPSEHDANDESKNMANTYSNLATGYKRLNFAPGAGAMPKAKAPPSSVGDAIVNDVSTATLVNYFNFDENLNKENEKSKKDKKRFYCLEWYNLSVTLKKNDRVLIDNVSGCALPGRILAIMGPSGAGKTTLLRGLTNRAPFARISGQIVFGKREFSSRDLMLVPQYDEFNANLTVFEMIEFIGHMKCANSTEMYSRLFSLLKILGLTNKAHALCSELTSGELKRVSVGMGMIANPNVLFLDEPTRGLDSTAAFAIVNYLSDLSRSTNVVIVMSIHQPAQIVFDKLQDLYLIGKEGRLAYFGPSNCATKYFEKYGFRCPEGLNAVDFYLDLIANPYPKSHDIESGAGKKVTSWQGLYAQSTLYQNIEVIMEHAVLLTTKAHEPPPLPSYTSRLWYMMKFFFSYYQRDLRLYYLRYAFLIICGVFIGTLFLHLRLNLEEIGQYAGAVFFCIWIVLYSVVASTGIYATDRRQTMELVKNAVIAPSFYCIAQFIVSIPFNLFGAVLFQSIFHWLTNINPSRDAFLYAIVITFGQLIMMESIMLTLVAWCKSALLSVSSAVVVLAYLFLFSGFVNPTAMPTWIRWLCDVSPVYYSFRGYLWVVFSDRAFEYGKISLPSELLANLIYGIRDLDQWKLFGSLIGWVFCYRFVHFLLFLYEAWPFLKAPSLETRTKLKKSAVK